MYIWPPLGFDSGKPLKKLKLLEKKKMVSCWLKETTSDKNPVWILACHASHITNSMYNCKFYQIFRIIVVVHFGNSSGLHLNKLMKYLMITIDWLTKQLPRASPKLLKLNFFKALALWAHAFYKSKCPSVCLSVCPSVCSLLKYRLNIFCTHFPKSDVQYF